MALRILLLLLSTSVMAADKDLLEKTYRRDNSFCNVGGKRLEILVRGDTSHTEPKERMWGEHVLARETSGRIFKLPVNQRSGLYRLFSGNPSSCTKSIGTPQGERFLVLFQKLNSPHKHQLVIQYLNAKTLAPEETLYTDYRSDEAQVSHGSLYFRSFPPARQDIEMGKVVIQGKTYLYQDHVFPIWMGFSQGSFFIEPQKTFEDFSYKSFFPGFEEFKRASLWDEEKKDFGNRRLYVAVNHASKTRCVLLLPQKKQLTGDDPWVCR